MEADDQMCFFKRSFSLPQGVQRGRGGCLQKSRDQSGGRASSRQDTMLCSLGVEATEMGKVDGFQGI